MTGHRPVRNLEGVFERFSPQARRVLVLAQEEARLLNHSYMGTEHLLLGLVHEGDGIAAQAIEGSGVSLEAVRIGVEEVVGAGSRSRRESPPFTSRAKKVLELSLRECLQLGHTTIDTEHLLLGLIREGDGVAVAVLLSLGVDLSRLRLDVIRLISSPVEHPESGTEEVAVKPQPPRCPRCRANLRDVARYEVIIVPAKETDSGEPALSIPVVFCNRCGTALGNSDMGRGLR